MFVMSCSSFFPSVAAAYFRIPTNLNEQDRQMRAIFVIPVPAIDVIWYQLTAQNKCLGSRKHLLWAFFVTLQYGRCVYNCIRVFKTLGESDAGSL